MCCACLPIRIAGRIDLAREEPPVEGVQAILGLHDCELVEFYRSAGLEHRHFRLEAGEELSSKGGMGMDSWRGVGGGWGIHKVRDLAIF